MASTIGRIIRKALQELFLPIFVAPSILASGVASYALLGTPDRIFYAGLVLSFVAMFGFTFFCLIMFNCIEAFATRNKQKNGNRSVSNRSTRSRGKSDGFFPRGGPAQTRPTCQSRQHRIINQPLPRGVGEIRIKISETHLMVYAAV